MTGKANLRLQLIFSLTFAMLLTPICGELNTTNCNRCMDNGIACASETQYYKCQNGIISTVELFDCPEEKICSPNIDLCINSSTIEPVVSPACPLVNVSFCRICAKINPDNDVTNTSFACVGPHHYKTCRDQIISNDMTLTCEKGKVCSIEAFEEIGKICVPKNEEANANNTASCLETPKLLHKELEKACSNYGTRPNIVCFNIENPYDIECKSYLHCTRKNNHLQGRVVKCEKGYFDLQQNKCIQERPAACGNNTIDLNLAATISPQSPTTTAGIKKQSTKLAGDTSSIIVIKPIPWVPEARNSAWKF